MISYRLFKSIVSILNSYIQIAVSTRCHTTSLEHIYDQLASSQTRSARDILKFRSITKIFHLDESDRLFYVEQIKYERLGSSVFTGEMQKNSTTKRGRLDPRYRQYFKTCKHADNLISDSGN